MNRVKVDTRRLNRIIKNVGGNVGRVVRSVGFAVERKAKEFAPVDTGALRASIYTRTYNGNELPTVANDAERVELPKPQNKTSVTVGPSMAYSIFPELGTSTQAAQPYLTPAVREVGNNMASFNGDFGKAVTDG